MADVLGGFPLNPYVSLTLMGVPTGTYLQPYKLEIHQFEFAHDIAVFSLWRESWSNDLYSTGSPIAIIYGNSGGNKEAFYGYINHVQQNHEFDRNVPLWNDVTVYCVGTSWLMKQTDVRVHKNITVSQLIAKIGQQFGMSTDVSPDSMAWPSITQSGGTTWKFLCDQAQKIGYTLFANRTDLRAFSRAQSLSIFNNKNYCPVYSKMQGNPAVFRFSPKSGAETPQSHYKDRVQYGMDHVTGQLFEVNNSPNAQSVLLGRLRESPFFQEFDPHLVSRSWSETKSKIDGVAENNRFYIKAEGDVTGDPLLHQTSIVYFDETFGNRQNGYWYVEGVIHEFDMPENQRVLSHNKNHTYRCKLSLGRDGYGSNGPPPQSVNGVRVLRSRNDAYNVSTVKTPPSILQNGFWRAQYATPVYAT